MPAPTPERGAPDPGGGAPGPDGGVPGHVDEALHAAFRRLQPTGRDAGGALDQLMARYGPGRPAPAPPAPAPPAGAALWKRRLGHVLGLPEPSRAGSAELEAAMVMVAEAVGSLSRRVEEMEDRWSRTDWRLAGSAWLAPAEALGPWLAPVAAHIVDASPNGEVLHADCGEGELLEALVARGVKAVGVEPRGTVALVALERGCTVTMGEVAEDLQGRDDASLGGLVLSGVPDRVPFPALLELLADAGRVLRPGAPVVVVVTEPDALAARWDVVARDVLAPRALAAPTWAFLLERAGFADAAPMDPPAAGEWRFAVSATAPT